MFWTGDPGEDDLPSTQQSDSEAAVLDCSVIAELRSIADSEGEDFLSDLAALFISDSAARIADLRLAVDAGDAAGAFAAAHTLAGSSANFGATDLTALCAALADVLRLGDVTAASGSVRLIDCEFERVEPAVRALIGSQ